MLHFSSRAVVNKRAPIVGVGLTLLFAAPLTFAQTSIAVNDTAQGPTMQNPAGTGDASCTLGDAILTANSLALNGTAVGGCQPVGSGTPYTVELTPQTYSLPNSHNYWYGPNALPPIATTIVIEGNGAILQIPANDQNNNPISGLRFFYVGADPNAPATLGFVTPGAGNLTLQNLTLAGGRQVGGNGGFPAGGGAGMGGAIFSQGILRVVNTTMENNIATGGLSDSSYAGEGAGGGGMGQHGNQLGWGGGFGGTLTSSVGGPFTALSKGAPGKLPNWSGGGAGFGLTDNGNSNGTGGGAPDGLGGQGSPTGKAGHGSGAGAIYYGQNSDGYGGDFGAGGRYPGGGGVGGGGGISYDPDGVVTQVGGGGFGGGSGGGYEISNGAGFGGGWACQVTCSNTYTSYGGSAFGAGAGMGGAIFNHGGSLTVLNSTLSGNSATGGAGTGGSGGAGFGGAIFNLNGTVSISFSTLDANSVTAGSGGSGASGGAVYSVGYNLLTGQAAALQIDNSILADTTGGPDLASDQPSNVASAAGGGQNVATASVTFTGANIVMNAAYTGNGAVNGPAPLMTSPQVAPLQLNAPGLTQTMAIASTSPAFQAAPCDPNVTTDQRGVTRPQPGTTACDIGAYELRLQSITFNAISQQVVGAKVTLSATTSSSLPVTFISLTPNVCSVSGNLATALQIGTCMIQASQAGNSDYAPAQPVTQGFSVVAAPNFSIKALPPAETVYRGNIAGFVLELDSINGFSGNVKLSCSGGPSGSVCADLPQTVSLLSGKAYAVSGLFFPKTAKAGTYTIMFTGVSGSLRNSITATFTVK
ncbi:hypothetical protein DYQ86_04615 [Acidobacteria bacterium AB60]|nr:hypothetical protein DYQ86_04615 [Acidobacteria bacterium AB60]